MKKKVIIVGVILVLSLSFVSYKYLVNENENKKEEKENSNPLEIIGKENIAYTLNGEDTDLSYNELINSKDINSIVCENGTKAIYDENKKSITLEDIKIPDYCRIDFKDKVNYLYSQILADHPSRGTERPNLNQSGVSGIYTEENTKTLYETTKTENGNKSYYFAGNSLDNWVYFAGIYWRIIRINEDNSVRLLYIGPDKNTTSGYISTSKYNSTYNYPRYVGYMYGQNSTNLASDRGNNTNSTIKGVIDSWYGTSITGKNDGTNTYDKYVSRTTIYCNDRSISSGSYGVSSGSNFYFGAWGRLAGAKNPSYKCGANTSNGLYESSQAVADKFSGSTTGGGNGKLSTAPVALMTADEVSFAGGVYATSAPAWYYYNAVGTSVANNAYWWTMSPYKFGGYFSSVFAVYGHTNDPGNLNTADVLHLGSVRPVVSLKSCVVYESGDGTSDNPYRVNIGGTCTNALN